MNKKMKLSEFIQLFEEYKKSGKETIMLKTAVVNDLIDCIKELDAKTQVLLSREYNLVVALRNKGVKEEEIKKLLELRMEE